VSRSFLAGLPGERLSDLAGETWPLSAHLRPAAATAMRGRIHGQDVVLAATDPGVASGAIGGAESEVLAAAVSDAVEHRLPLVLLIDSAGALLTEGVAVLGAFRRLYRSLLVARDAGLPILAVLGRNCFGGASLLAFAADTRIYPQGCRLGLSGPRALRSLGTGPEADAAVLALYGAESRCRHDEDGVIVSDDSAAVAAVVQAWLAEAVGRTPASAAAAAGRLARRLSLYRGDPSSLSSARPPAEVGARLDRLFPGGWSAAYSDGVVWGEWWADGRESCFAGFVGGRPVGAFACVRMMEVLRGFAEESPILGVTLLLDSPGQMSDVDNEQILLSEFVARVADLVHALAAEGRLVDLWLVGEGGGAIYLALAAAATRVTAWPGMRIQTLPPRVVDGVLGQRRAAGASLEDLLEARVIDGWASAAPNGNEPGWAAPD
jgi:acetyl-CoA carboxylase alpha subunit